MPSQSEGQAVPRPHTPSRPPAAPHAFHGASHGTVLFSATAAAGWTGVSLEGLVPRSASAVLLSVTASLTAATTVVLSVRSGPESPSVPLAMANAAGDSASVAVLPVPEGSGLEFSLAATAVTGTVSVSLVGWFGPQL